MNRGLLAGAAAALLLACISRVDLIAQEGGADGAAAVGVDLYGDPLPDGAVLRLGTMRLRNRQLIQSAAFSPGGRLLASTASNDDAGVAIWDADGEKESFTGAAQPVVPANFAFGGGGPQAGVIAPLAFSPEGTRLAAGAAKILIWDLESGEPLMEIDGVPQKLVSLCFTPDGAQLISGGTRMIPQETFGKPYPAKNVWVPEIRFWNVADGKQVRALTTDEPEPGFGAVALASDGRTLAAGYEPKLLIWDLPECKVRHTIVVPKWWGEYGLAISSDGKVVAAPLDNALGMWDATTGMPLLSELQSHTSWIPSVAYGADGESIVTGGADGTVRAWDPATGRPRYVRSLGSGRAFVNAVALSPDGKVLAVGDGHAERSVTGGLLLFHTDTGKPLEMRLLEDDEKLRVLAVAGLAFSLDGTLLAVARHDDAIEIWDVTSGRNVVRISTEFVVGTRTMAFSADAKTLFAIGRQAEVRSWDLAGVKRPGEFKAVNTKIERGEANQRPWVSDAVFLPGGKHLVTSQNRHLVIWDLGTGDALWTIRTPGTDKGRTLGGSPDGRLLALCDVNYGDDRGSNTIRVWNLDTGQQLASFEPGDSRAASFAFSPDGARLVSGMDDGTALVWDLTR
jgi:WD40 repeat protein